MIAGEITNSVVHQEYLKSVLRYLFPYSQFSDNARKETSIINPETGSYLELDICIPEHNITFEFQDAYHYVTIWYTQAPLLQIQSHDNIKQELVHKSGDTLVIVPCWWDGSAESLSATIHFQRPDLLEEFSAPIPLSPPYNYFLGGKVLGVGELMVASFPSNNLFINSISPENPWWLGEKYDGIRFCWNPIVRRMYTRQGLPLSIYPPLLPLLPACFLDGECWLGRGSFDQSQQLVAATLEYISWQFIRMVVFDVPSVDQQKNSFEKRYSFLLSNLTFEHPYANIPARVLCVTKKQVTSSMRSIMRDGGEGVILRKHRSVYERGKSLNLVKLKASRGDQEAIVLSVGDAGHVKLKLPDGTTFTVSPQDVRVSTSLAKGDIITFSYDRYSRRSAPASAKIYQIRKDLVWDDVIRSYKQELPKNQIINSSSREIDFKEKPRGYWQRNRMKKMRMFLEEFARKKGLEPLLPDTWYDMPRKEIQKVKGGDTIIAQFGGLVPALVQLFPDIKFHESRFRIAALKNSLQQIKKRRNWFSSLASQLNLDPLLADSWYQIMAHKQSEKTQFILNKFYEGNWQVALLHLFPELKLEENKFPSNYWADPNNIRSFFAKVAEGEKFDSLMCASWYNISLGTLLSYKDAYGIWSYYKKNFTKALQDTFPEIALDKLQFRRPLWKSWEDPENRKWFFVEFARRNAFDHLIPDNWYLLDTTALTDMGVDKIIKYHGGSIKKALLDLFPDIGLQESRFKTLPREHWKAKKAKDFFEIVAKTRGFDPYHANNWYSFIHKDFVAEKGASTILEEYKSFSNALVAAFPDIGLDPSKFVKSPRHFWKEKENRIAFFVDFARSHGVDPLVAEAWYKIPAGKISTTKGGSAVLDYHGGSLSKALKDLFPQLQIDESKFLFLPRNYWKDKVTRRAFFESFAEEHKFDALEPKNWYLLRPVHVTSYKGVKGLLINHYQGSLAKALIDLFPNIGLEESKF